MKQPIVHNPGNSMIIKQLVMTLPIKIQKNNFITQIIIIINRIHKMVEILHRNLKNNSQKIKLSMNRGKTKVTNNFMILKRMF